MTNFRFSRPLAALAACVVAFASPTAPLQAAPDDTLGMALMFAVVNSGGQLVRGAGAVSASTDELGLYTVTFDRSVANCAFSPTIAALGMQALAPGMITAAAVAGQAGQVRVGVFDSTANPTDLAFHLTVFCSR